MLASDDNPANTGFGASRTKLLIGRQAGHM